jgi:hypothetical protein
MLCEGDSTVRPDLFHALQAKRASRRRTIDQWFRRLGLFLTLTTLGVLGILLLNLAMNGLARIDWNFLSSFPSRRAGEAGVLSAWVGTLLLMMVTAGAAVPFGLAAGIYLEEYAPKNRWTDVVEINIANLAGVPSILYGLMALGLFVYQFQFGQSVLAGVLALACLVLPIVIVATREALRTIPSSIREAAFALAEYFEEYEADTGEELELDVVGIRCDWDEYKNAEEIAENYSHAFPQSIREDKDKLRQEVIDYLSDKTQFIKLESGGFLVVAF